MCGAVSFLLFIVDVQKEANSPTHRYKAYWLLGQSSLRLGTCPECAEMLRAALLLYFLIIRIILYRNKNN